MRFVQFANGQGGIEAAVVDDGALYPVGVAMQHLIGEGLNSALCRGATAIAEHPPVAQEGPGTGLVPLYPRSFRDFMTFYEHTVGTSGTGVVSAEWYEQPVFYFSNTSTCIPGDGTVVEYPPGSVQLDFELEVAAVITGRGRNLTAAGAARHVFGYTIVNDWSARDTQLREMRVGLGPAKGKDFATTIGPCIVTADEFEDRRTSDGRLDADVRAYVNGQLVCADNLVNMSWRFEELIAQASRGSVVDSGDIVGSGTAGNGGCLLELRRSGQESPDYLAPGDEVRLEVDGLGSITNIVGSHTQAPQVGRARPPLRPRRHTTAAVFGTR
ncbi:fumarylacetoacetate hydrolase family protein [Mycolicibacterium palauense]|uniref:fumarylacetoacetate hydrolase family protein n=1 Tax=Mycolicibacterium palauense TaxID=2034511 RepID=UPI000BFEEB68|nr:fumarylacetoacetate hydrolase family protein [Mycolicibacterium palauense]